MVVGGEWVGVSRLATPDDLDARENASNTRGNGTCLGACAPSKRYCDLVRIWFDSFFMLPLTERMELLQEHRRCKLLAMDTPGNSS